MRQITRTTVWLLGSLILLHACERASSPPADAGSGTLMLLYQEQEPGIDVYRTRIIVTPEFVRMDEGVLESDFTLFDRGAGVIYSVSHENRTVLSIQPSADTSGKAVESPLSLELSVRKNLDAQAPEVAGEQPVHYSLLVNGVTCKELMVVPSLHPRAVHALREFRRVLAQVHKQNLANTPPEMQDPCFLAHDVFQPGRSLAYGLPIREWDAAGRKRALVDYQGNYATSPELFDLPEGYRQHPFGSP